MRRPHSLLFLLAATLALIGDAAAATLRMVKPSLPPSLGNPFTATGQPSLSVWSAVYDPLTRIGENGELEPGLATAWRAIDDRTWVFDLREGVTFHSGNTFDAATVIGVIDFLKSPAGRGQLVAAELANVTGARARGPYQVEFKTATPDAIFPRRLSVITIVEPRLLASGDLSTLNRETSGTGPYRIKDWGGAGTATMLESFPASWRNALPDRGNVDRVEMVISPDTAARMQAFTAGGIDVIEAPDPDAAELSDPGVKVVNVPSASVLSIALRNFGPVPPALKDKRVRQALNYAVNRQRIAATILSNRAAPASQGAVPGVIGFNPALAPYPYDPARAKALLAEAGYPDGFAFDVEIITSLAGSDALTYQQIVQDLAAVGVKATIRPIPYASWLSKYISGQWGTVGGFTMAWDNNAYYDVGRPLRTHSCAKINPFYCDEDLVPRILATDSVFDEAARSRLLQDLMAELHERAPSLWIAQTVYIFAARGGVENLHFRQGSIVFERVRLAPR